MDRPWKARSSEGRDGGRRRSTPTSLLQEDYGVPPNQSMMGFLSDLRNNLPEPFLQKGLPQMERTLDTDMDEERQGAHDYWQTQLEQHQKQFQRHQKRWQMQQQEWLEHSSEWQGQQVWQRNMRRRGGKKPEKPRWTCLEELQKTLTIDSAEEDTTATGNEAVQRTPQRRSSQVEDSMEEAEEECEQRPRRRNHKRDHSERSHRSHVRSGPHKVRWGGIEPPMEEEQQDFEDQEGLEADQQPSLYTHVSPVTSPRFGSPESPVSQRSTGSPPRSSPVFGSNRSSAKEHREGISYMQPWQDGTTSFPPSASTVATAVDSPGRGSSRRDQHQASRHQAGCSDEQKAWEQEEALEEHEFDPATPRRQWLLNMAARFQRAPGSRQQHDEKQAKWRSDLQNQLDEGLREALAHDMLEFQKEAFFGARGKNGSQQKLKLKVLEEGVEWRDDTPEEKEEAEDTGEAEAATQIEEPEQAEDDGHVGDGTEAEEEVVEELEAEPIQSAAEEDAGESEEITETEEPVQSALDEETPELEEQEVEVLKEEPEQDEEATESHLAEEMGEEVTDPAGQETEGEMAQEGSEDEHDRASAEPIDEGDAPEEESPQAETAETTEENYEMEELQLEEVAGDAADVVEGEEEEPAAVEEEQEGEEKSALFQEECESAQPSVFMNETATNDQLTLEALRALSLGILRPEPQGSWEGEKDRLQHLGERAGEIPSSFEKRMPAPLPAFGSQQLQASGLASERIPTPEPSCNSSVTSVSSSVPSDFQWWAPSKDISLTSTSSPEKEEQQEEAKEEVERESQSKTGSCPPSPVSPATPAVTPEQATQRNAESPKKEAPTPPSEEVEAAAPAKIESTAAPLGESPAALEQEAVSPATVGTSTADAVVASTPPAPEPASSPLSESTVEKEVRVEAPQKDNAAAEEAAAAAKEATAAASTAKAAALEAARAAAAAAAALAAHTAAAEAARKEAATEEPSSFDLTSLNQRDLHNFQRLQRIREERAARAKAAGATAVRRSNSGSAFRETSGGLVPYQSTENDVLVTPSQTLPAPPPARVLNGRAQVLAMTAETVAKEHHEAQIPQQRPRSQSVQTECDWKQDGSDVKPNQELQGALRVQLQQQLEQQQRQHKEQQELQQQQRHLLQLQLDYMQQENKRQQRGPEPTPRQTPRVRFSDDAVKNEELKEQLAKQSKELRKLRRFRDQQQVLHQETEKHLDTLHRELQKLVGENVSLLHAQEQIGKGAQRAAFQLLLLHAAQQKKLEDKRDAAVSPRNEQSIALEHVLQQNRELEQMQWQLQQLRQRIVDSQGAQQHGQQRVRELQESEAKLQEENRSLKQMLEAMQTRQMALAGQGPHDNLESKPEGTAVAEAQAEAFATEQQARREAEEQLRETMEVMQLLKHCLQEQKDQVASLEQQLEEQKRLNLQQEQQKMQQGHDLAVPPQSATIFDVLAREAEGKEAPEVQSKSSATTQTERIPRKSLRHSSTATQQVETTETGVQAGPPMPYGKTIPKEAEQQQQLTRQAAEQQQLVAKLKAALATQAKAFSQDKAYYQQLVLQLQQRIAELERYQHQLLLHVQQQQQALLAHSGRVATQYQPPVYQASLPFDPAQAAIAAAAAVLQQGTISADAVQKSARDAAERQQQHDNEMRGGETNSISVVGEGDPAPSNTHNEDWLKLLADAIEGEDEKQEQVAGTDEQQEQLRLQLGSAQGVQCSTPPTSAAAAGQADSAAEADSGRQELAVLPTLAGTAAPTASEEQPITQAVTTAGKEPSSQPFQEQMQQLLIRQLQDKFEGRVFQHLEKVQRALKSPPLQTTESSRGGPLDLAAPSDSSAGGSASQRRAGQGANGEGDALFSRFAGPRGEESRPPKGEGLQQALAQREQQSAEQRLFLRLQQQFSMHSTTSSPACISPVGTVDSVAISAPIPAGMELARPQGVQLKRYDISRSPITSTTASSVAADFNADETSGGALLPPSKMLPPAEETEDKDVPGARQKVQQFRRLLRQQGLLS